MSAAIKPFTTQSTEVHGAKSCELRASIFERSHSSICRARIGLFAILAVLIFFSSLSRSAQNVAQNVTFRDITVQAGIHFTHNNGAFGKKWLPETMGPGCAFIDYDNDGWPDILLVNGADWPGHYHGGATTMKLYRNNHDGTFTDVTVRAGLAVSFFGMGVAVGDYDNDGFDDIFITAVGQSRLFHNNGNGTFTDVTRAAGMWGPNEFSTSAAWVDYDRDGKLDLVVANYVQWSEAGDLYCTLDGTHKSYCTPESYKGTAVRLWHNLGGGKFEDATAKSGLGDPTSKSLGIAVLDANGDGWPDLLIANDTQPNKLYKNLQNGKFRDVALDVGLAFSMEGKARAGMGVDVADFENSGNPGVAITNFDNEMIGFYRQQGAGNFVDVAAGNGIGRVSRNTLGFGCVFADMELDGALDLIAVNGHIDETVRNVRNVGYAQPPELFLNQGHGAFVDVAADVGGGFATPKVGRGVAYGDFDRDGDVDILMTTNNGPAYLFRNDQLAGNRSIRFKLTGTKSNRDGIGAIVRVYYNGVSQMRIVKSGSSYLSQSELPVTFGVGKHDAVERVTVEWPSGRNEEFTKLSTGKQYVCTEGKGISVER